MRRGLFAMIVMALMLFVPSVMLLAQEEKAPGAKETKDMKHMEHMKPMKMQLTDEQKAKIKEIRMNQRLKVIDAKAAMEKDAIMLRKELAKDQPSMTEIEPILKKLADARVAMQTVRIEGLLEVRKILGPDWKAMRDRRMGDDPMESSEMEEEGESEGAESPAMEHMSAVPGCGMGMGMTGGDRRTVIVLNRAGRGMGMGRTGEWRMVQRRGGAMREGGMMMGRMGMGCCCCCCMGMGMGGNMMHKGEGMKMGEMGCGMMQKGGEGAGMGKGCGMMQKGEGMKKGGMGSCMMHKGGEGAGMAMSGCMTTGKMGGACMKNEGAKGSCSGSSEGWANKGLYRPRARGMSGKACAGTCKSEMKEKTETKQ
jgi:Spy/CpxP family protein refolding chaperone